MQNRDFEYVAGENGRVKDWGPTYAWSVEGDGMVMAVDTVRPVHANNPHYLALDVRHTGAALVNSGFDGMVVKEGERYDFSFFCRTSGKGGKLEVCLRDESGNVLWITGGKMSVSVSPRRLCATAGREN